MEYTTLGRTGIKVSVAGLGCGGPSRLGLRQGKSDKGSIALLRQAIDLGVNFLDTAESYGTEEVVGKAIAGVPRDQLVISTKKTFPLASDADPEKEVRKSLQQSLKRLCTDHIDVYHVHGVEPRDYPYVKERLLPVFERLREEGKIRSIGITERFVEDPTHEMLQQALHENCWDVIMVGFSLLNPNARRNIFPLSRSQSVGVLDMYAVRRGLSQPSRLKSICEDLAKRGLLAPGSVNSDGPLDFVIHEGGALTIPEAAYRFCRHEPGVDVVLTGTGNPEHLESNIAALLKPPLPESVLARLDKIFGSIEFLTGN